MERPPTPARSAGAQRLLHLALLLILAAGFTFLGLKIFGGGAGPLHDPEAAPRPVTPRGELAPHEKTRIALYRKSAPSVVFITNMELELDPFTMDPMTVPKGSGSGIIWDENGYIVTNHHVVHGGQAWKVMLEDQRDYRARLVGGAPEKDLAVLKIDAPERTLKPITVGSSHDLRVGQTVLAIGNPFGLDQTVTEGIISGLGRVIRSPSGVRIRGVIQTDAAINPGNSGGPLLDIHGRLIGLNTAIYSPSGAYAGVGFAVPVDTVNRIVPQIIRKGHATRPGLGITIVDDWITRRMGLQGVMVGSVLPDSAAEKAGLKGTRRTEDGRTVHGDRIIALDGERVHSSAQLMRMLLSHRVGETVTLTLAGGQGTRQVEVKLQALDDHGP